MELAFSLNDNLVIMSTNIVASILLMRRQGGMKEDDLLEKTTWLFKEIQARNGSMSMNVALSKTSLRTSLKYLQNFIDMKKDTFSPYIKANMDYKNILMLAYYRNNLIHLFLSECYVATSMYAFGEEIIV
jgi:glycerone phosphate O-acyltransferase/fatty acyl-CoA reductase